MKAWLLEGLGGLDRMHLGEAADPTPAEGEVVLRVKYAALNPADRYLSEGQYPAKPSFPHILGRDGLGTVIAVGKGVSRWREGDRVIVLRNELGVNRWGTLAEKVAAPESVLAEIPAGWDDAEAAGAPLVYLTAYQALTQWAAPLPPSNVLITGASGGVGVASIQLAKAMGHKVIAMSRGDSKRDALTKLGADAVLDPNDTQWRKRCRDVLAGGRIDVAIDNIGGSLFSELLDVLGEDAKVAVIGRLAGPVPQFNTASLFFRRITIRGVFVGSYKALQAQAAWKEILEMMKRAGAKPQVDRVFPFEKVKDAFERLAQGPLGKVLIDVEG